MTSRRSTHPLDVDLADLVAGLLDNARATEVDAHLTGCFLCRLKRLRLADAPAFGGTAAFPLLHFPLPPALEQTADPAAGELWLAGDDEWLLVVVIQTDGDRFLVAPVTLDVEAADDETVIVDAGRSPLGVALALYPALASEVPRSALVGGFTGIVPVDGPGGPPLTGAEDPRLELRQHLADLLGSLDDVSPDPATGAGTLVADLRALRGRACAVRPLDAWPDLTVASGSGWAPLATVDEVGIVLVVLDTPHGLSDDTDFDTARAVLTRFNASALVVLARQLSDLADVFDAPALNYGIDVPSGAHTAPRPLIAGLSAFDAIAKYLDQHSGARVMSPPTRGPVARIDVAHVLREAAVAAGADAVRQGGRFKIAPKRRGYESLAGAPEGLGAALGHAFTDGSVVEALLALARRDDE